MKGKFHKGQRHKGCGLCDQEKRAGNGAERRPARDRRAIAAANDQIDRVTSPRPESPIRDVSRWVPAIQGGLPTP